MNCDEAFDIFTMPDGLPNERLARHLANCPRCRQMKETLEPALALFDADTADEFHSNDDAEIVVDSTQQECHPRRVASSDAVRLAMGTAAELSSQVSSPASRFRRMCGLIAKQTAFVFLGAVVAFGLVNLPNYLQKSVGSPCFR